MNPLFRGIAALMEDLPLKKLRNFGGKLGAELQALGATTVGQVSSLPSESFPLLCPIDPSQMYKILGGGLPFCL